MIYIKIVESEGKQIIVKSIFEKIDFSSLHVIFRSSQFFLMELYDFFT